MTSDHKMREFNRRLERHYATMQSILARLTTLEQSCNASHAPSDGSSAASGGTTGASTSSGGRPSSIAATPTSAASGAKPDADSAAVRADPKRPWWFPLECLPLPEGTKRVGLWGGLLVAYPSGMLWTRNEPTWEQECPTRQPVDDEKVYHVPAPSNEHQDHSPAESEQERPEVCNVSDANVEAMRDRLKARAAKGLQTYGVTTERTDLTTDEWLEHAIDEALDLSVYLQKIRTLLPNRRVQGEGEVPLTCAKCLKPIVKWTPTLVRRNPDTNLCDAYCPGCAPSPRPAKSAGEVAEEVVEQWVNETRSCPLSKYRDRLKELFTAAIERERGSAK